MMWLLDRLNEVRDQQNPEYAFLGTVNWIGALAYLCSEYDYSDTRYSEIFAGVSERRANEAADTLVLHYLIMSFHNTCSIIQSNELGQPYSIVRSSIVSWYYSIYYAAKSMIAATSGQDPQTHAGTARAWQSDIVERGNVCEPFNYSIRNLTPQNVISEMDQIRGNNTFNLNSNPDNNERALGAIYSYLNGTAGYERNRLEADLRRSREFLNLGVDNFRTATARQLRDRSLLRGQVNFLVQAFRFRGKANYRDVIYLSYGEDRSEQLSIFLNNLSATSIVFAQMATAYSSRRVLSRNWQSFIQDIDPNIRFALPFPLAGIRT